MVKVPLPLKLKLVCPDCQGGFSVQLKQIHARFTLACPYCGEKFNTYDALTGLERRRVYHALRDRVEQMIYEQKLEEGDVAF
jgi:transcription elongation factor Elf1